MLEAWKQTTTKNKESRVREQMLLDRSRRRTDDGDSFDSIVRTKKETERSREREGKVRRGGIRENGNREKRVEKVDC